MFRKVSLSIIRSLAQYTQQYVYVIQATLTACEQEQMLLLTSCQHNLYDIYLLLCVLCQTPDGGQRNFPKHVEIYSKNKFEKLVHLLGFIIRTVRIVWRFSSYYMRDRRKRLQYPYPYIFSLQKPQPGSRDPTRSAHLSVACNSCRCDCKHICAFIPPFEQQGL